MKKIVTFGEVMGRLATPGFQLFRQGLPGTLDVSFAGAEANVAVSLSMLGADATFVSALPNHAVADACIDTLKRFGVNTDYIRRTDQGRFGLYFLESGANQRPSRVFYDRDATAFSKTLPNEYDWEDALADAGWLHVTGISPAVSCVAAEATRVAVEQAKRQGVTVSCDLNFRNRLWQWDQQLATRDLANQTMRSILPFIDLLIANEEDCSDVLGIRAGQSDAGAGKLEIERFPDVANEVVQQFPNLSHVAITLRESVSASHNNWGAMLYDAPAQKPYFSPLKNGSYRPFEIRNIVDRVGGGDSFAAGLIFAFCTPDLSAPASAIDFAVAASCLAHSISGDFNFSSRADVEKLMRGSASGRVER